MLFEGTPRGGTRSGGGRTRRYYNGNAEPARTGGLFQNEGQADSDRPRAASEGTAHGTSPCDDEHHAGASTSRSPRRAGKRSEVQRAGLRAGVPDSRGAKRSSSSRSVPRVKKKTPAWWCGRAENGIFVFGENWGKSLLRQNRKCAQIFRKTCKNRKNKAKTGQNIGFLPRFCCGGQRWIRTTEVEDVRFTV